MKCPHCGVEFHAQVHHTSINHFNSYTKHRVASVHCPKCKDYSLFLEKTRFNGSTNIVDTSRLILPIGADRGPVAQEVRSDIAEVYIEACNVLPLSSKASAALARRVLQTILHDQGYKARDLNSEIELLLNEADPTKSIPRSLRETVDGIRNFGNFSAHPITDKTTLQIIDVEPEEAEWCLEIVESMFDHYYVRPAEAKRRKDALNAKLLSAGKPLAK